MVSNHRPNPKQSFALRSTLSIICVYVSVCLCVTYSLISVTGMLPKFFYMILQLSFLVALVALNWDFLTSETDGILLFVTLVVCTLGTLIFYFLTGTTDPGFVRNQIFENQYETTELQDDCLLDEVAKGGSSTQH